MAELMGFAIMASLQASAQLSASMRWHTLRKRTPTSLSTCSDRKCMTSEPRGRRARVAGDLKFDALI
eukprot:3122789-Pyramimonas_sp.AAC.2